MLSSKSKSGLSDSSINKGPQATPATPRASKLGRTGSTKQEPDSPSPQQTARLSIDRSPRSVDSTPAVNRRSPKISTPDKQPRNVKGSELQTQFTAIQEELKKAKDLLLVVEKEKAIIAEELKGAKAAANEANEKLQDALVSQRLAEESSEIDKFRADELEQSSIEATQKREEEWQKELQSVRDQHAVDVAALLATTQELQRVQHDLAMTTEAKNTALSHADDAMKIAEINADKMELLSGEINRLKALLDSPLESKSSDVTEVVKNACDLPGQLSGVQEELKKANEKLTAMEKEKIQIFEELKDAKKLAEEANEKLRENLDANKKSEEDTEAYKLRAQELEQENIKASQKEEEQQKELQILKDQHATDIAAFLSAKEALDQLKHELAMTVEAKNEALSHADDAMNIAEVNTEKVKILTEDVNRLKALLDSKQELEGEVVALKYSLDKAKEDEKKLVAMEELVNGLKVEVSDAKKAEAEVGQQLEEWKKKTQLLEGQLDKANQSNELTRNSLASALKQLDEINVVLQDKECEVAALAGKMQSLEVEISSYKAGIDESHKQLEATQHEALEIGKALEGLKLDLQSLEEEKMQALDKEKQATSSIESLTEEKNRLIAELQAAQADAENNKAAMDRLASALHEVSTEAREAQERFLVKKTEVETAHSQIEELELKVEKTKEENEAMLAESKEEIRNLQCTVERFEMEVERLSAKWISKEHDFESAIRRSEEELATIKGEMDGIVESLKAAELQLQVAKEEEVHRLSKLQDLESQLAIAKKATEEVKAECLKLKDLLLDKESELQSIVQENDDLKVREADVQNKVKELSSLLAEATEKNSTVVTIEKSSDIASPAPFSMENAHSDAEVETLQSEEVSGKADAVADEINKVKENSDVSVQEEQPLEVEGKIHENGKVIDKDLSLEGEHDSDSTDDEVETTKLDGSSFDQTNETSFDQCNGTSFDQTNGTGFDQNNGTGFDQTNGTSFDQANGLASENFDNGTDSPTKQYQLKKKKGFVQKVGSLLKKKSSK